MALKALLSLIVWIHSYPELTSFSGLWLGALPERDPRFLADQLIFATSSKLQQHLAALGTGILIIEQFILVDHQILGLGHIAGGVDHIAGIEVNLLALRGYLS
jgi:hypothetical protein